jgi:hypothetical protein
LTSFCQKYEYRCTVISGSVAFFSAEDSITVKGLQAVPNGNITELMLFGVYGSFNFIPKKVFEVFPNLTYFYIRSLNSGLVTNAIINCLKLRTLTFSESNLPTLSAGFAETCENLEKLDLFGSTLGTIDVDAFRGLKNLLELEITDVDYLNPLLFVHTPKLHRLHIRYLSKIPLRSRRFNQIFFRL